MLDVALLAQYLAHCAHSEMLLVITRIIITFLTLHLENCVEKNRTVAIIMRIEQLRVKQPTISLCGKIQAEK